MQTDIRALFRGGNGKPKEITQIKQPYKERITALFRELEGCIKEQRLPRFLPLFTEEKEGKVDGSLMGRCRRSLARFVPKEALEDVLYFVMETVSESTPQDETRADFVQGIHACVDTCLEKRQPFLVKSVWIVCYY